MRLISLCRIMIRFFSRLIRRGFSNSFFLFDALLSIDFAWVKEEKKKMIRSKVGKSDRNIEEIFFWNINVSFKLVN